MPSIANPEFGMECHMNGQIDGMFGTMVKRLRIAAQEQTISKAKQVFSILESRADDDEIVLLLVPTMERKSYIDQHPPVVAKSLPSKIKSSYIWRFIRKDRKRISCLGRDGRTLTEMKAPMIMSMTLHEFSSLPSDG